MEKNSFIAQLNIIGINPFVYVPRPILKSIFKQAGKNKSPIAVKGTINRQPYTQTLVRFKGEWRLYINTNMLTNSPQRIGEHIQIRIAFDASDRNLPLHPKLKKALENNSHALAAFNSYPPYLQQEIIRYITNLKTEKSVDKNVKRAILFLEGNERFLGRDSP